MIPRKAGLPGIILELKYDQSPETALAQIKKRQYVKTLAPHAKRALFVGINYGKKEKRHQCLIEEVLIASLS